MNVKDTLSVDAFGKTAFDQTSLQALWDVALGEIEVQVSRPNFVTWFKNTCFLEKCENTAKIGLPNNFAKEWIENKYAKIVLGALRNLEESITRIEFVVHSGAPETYRKKNRSPRRDFGQEITSPQATFPELRINPETNLNPRYTLSSYMVGKANELAYAAATAITESVGTKYNPFFIYGGVGLGKTHLLQSIGNEIISKYSSGVRVKYVSSERFTNDVIWAIRNKRMETVKEKYRFVDVLIVDDIQFIIGKTATEEEFFHTFNALYENNKQIIISSDKSPKFMPELAERLRSRFEGGMIVDIGYPDYELRFAIIKAKLQERGLIFPDAVVAVIAEKIQKSFREIEGALNRITFYQKTKQIPLTPQAVEGLLSEIIQEPTKHISPNDVLHAVCGFFEVSNVDIVGQSRKREFVRARQIAMYLLRDMLDLSYPNIGDRIGKRDHTTALYAYEKMAKEVEKNTELNQKIINIRELITRE